MTSATFPKKERNTFKFPSLANTLLLNVYIYNKIGHSFFN